MSLLDVYQFYAHALVRIFDELRDTEILLGRRIDKPQREEEKSSIGVRFAEHLAKLKSLCIELELSSSQKQVDRIINIVFGKIVDGPSVVPMLAELRTRISEDLESHVYFYVSQRFVEKGFKKDDEGRYISKTPSELMDAKVVERFPSASDDIEDTYRCFVCGFYPASMFHLMRVLEVAVLELGEVTGLDDVKPSWGAVLKHVEKLVLRTKYEDLPESAKPHRKMLELVLPQMQAIQRAWRNKFLHIDNKIILTEPIDEKVATPVLMAVEAFLYRLALDLPKTE